VIIYIYGLARAWALVGVRQFHIQDVLNPSLPKGGEENAADRPHTEPVKENSVEK
jgi:hypothetical protein